MKTKEQVEALFRSDLTALLKKYGAELEAKITGQGAQNAVKTCA